MPNPAELPKLISSIRHPRRNRSVSIGPQSEADAYETLAFRDKVRRESFSSGKHQAANQSLSTTVDADEHTRAIDDSLRMRPQQGDNAGHSDFVMVDMPGSSSAAPAMEKTSSQQRREDEKEKQEVFSKVEKPRVRYDVEVVTKLIVYAGTLFILPALWKVHLTNRRYRLDCHRGSTYTV